MTEDTGAAGVQKLLALTRSPLVAHPLANQPVVRVRRAEQAAPLPAVLNQVLRREGAGEVGRSGVVSDAGQALGAAVPRCPPPSTHLPGRAARQRGAVAHDPQRAACSGQGHVHAPHIRQEAHAAAAAGVRPAAGVWGRQAHGGQVDASAPGAGTLLAPAAEGGL